MGMASPPPMKAKGTIGRAGLQRQAHEAGAEVHQRVAVLPELGGAARALGEDHQQAVVLEQALGVLGQAGELAAAGCPDGGEGKRLMNFSAMPWASRGGSISRKQDAMTMAPSSATPPEWLPTSMARPARRHVLDALAAHLEVVAVEEAEGAHAHGQVPLGNAIGVDSTGVERQLQPVDARGDLVAGHGANITGVPSLRTGAPRRK